MTRRRWWIVGGTVLAAAALIAMLCVVLLTHRSPTDCTTVRSMISYNKQFNYNLEANSETNAQPTVTDYADWASRMHELAGQIHNAALAPQANSLADLADQTVTVVKQFHSDTSSAGSPASAPPQYAKDYARLGKEFNANLVALDEACPA
jgi:hypothetical protein